LHVHDAGGDGFNPGEKPRRQANPDEDDNKDAHKNNFPAACGGRRFGFTVSLPPSYDKTIAGRESKKIARPIEKNEIAKNPTPAACRVGASFTRDFRANEKFYVEPRNPIVNIRHSGAAASGSSRPSRVAWKTHSASGIGVAVVQHDPIYPRSARNTKSKPLHFRLFSAESKD